MDWWARFKRQRDDHDAIVAIRAELRDIQTLVRHMQAIRESMDKRLEELAQQMRDIERRQSSS